MMTIFALVDCNNFYVSCERVFNPALEKKPVVVLSNNDGCIISRSAEAKQLGIPMGAPFFKWEPFCKAHDVAVFSSNYELYGDMSQRVMTLLTNFCIDIEIYSIDEAFLILDAQKDASQIALNMRQFIKTCTGIPVSVGIAHTKTLAKLANQLAKKKTTTGVFNLCDLTVQNEALQNFSVRDVWGVGHQLAEKFKQLNLFTAKDLRDADPKFLRSHFSVMVERTITELRGISCIAIEQIAPRQQIISSRSFGKPVTELTQLEEAVSFYASIAAKKLRQQKCVAGSVGVFLQTNLFAKTAPYGNSVIHSFPIPTADTLEIIRIAKRCIQHIYRAGHRYHKAGVLLLDLKANNIKQLDMLTHIQNYKREKLMQTMDLINDELGAETIFCCALGIKREWKIKFNKLSQRYTTRWNELKKVNCN